MRLLVLAGEDFTGLWDAASEATSANSATGESPEPGELVRDALGHLLEQGLIELFTRRSDTWEFDAIRQSEIEAALRAGRVWEAPTGPDPAGRIYIAATRHGLERLHQANWGESE